ncbi:nuclear export factor [Schizosaccharomyces octosporus yFS286]|uniref:Nuclear export factor n=1 Tax=Schizosaccharomyces octosporus (strain yFS286) TaxID=483514 RepID=S9PW77_SCHOY|nr:nuclear export factor [Schizosaccharomyces octosporus yFS286]EPX71733.1 nuclear export factor [Schizosaccharomyces octosporus yFS286]
MSSTKKAKSRPRPSMDLSNSSKRRAARSARFSSDTDLKYQTLRRLRIKEQEAFEAQQSKHWKESSILVGTCTQMCPNFEIVERTMQKSIHPYEKHPQTHQPDPEFTVKAYHRPAAGKGPILPSDVRPPALLKKTTEYLFQQLLQKHPFQEAHAFVRDRTRAIRQDFSVQSSFTEESIYCHELIARFHIVSLHELKGQPSFSSQQEVEQLSKVLYTLGQLYDYKRMKNQASPHEPEFRAYMALLCLGDPALSIETLSWSSDLIEKPIVRTALALHSYAQRNNHFEQKLKHVDLSLISSENTEAAPNFYTRFFKLAKSFKTTFLMACILDMFLPSIRTGALKAMKKSYLSAHANIPFNDLLRILSVSHNEELIKICQSHGLQVEFTDGLPSSVVLNKRVLIHDALPVDNECSYLADTKYHKVPTSDIICIASDRATVQRRRHSKKDIRKKSSFKRGSHPKNY